MCSYCKTCTISSSCIYIISPFYSIYSGVYGFEDYYISDPVVLIVLSGTPVYNHEGLFHQLPDDLQLCLKQHVS